mmetsp:Transcript_92150/g.211013  ORF Transcript_92150/g.211013 Transcript_92150/m.211013 type:complete len:186 (-) Transcript_92150:126-683(-)
MPVWHLPDLVSSFFGAHDVLASDSRHLEAGVATSFLNFFHPIDHADASSTYDPSDSTLSIPPVQFQAKAALHPGSGYWCSAGDHDPNEVVSWTGSLDHRRPAEGIKIDWAYAPGEVRVRTSPDGENWVTAVDWTREPQSAGHTTWESFVQDLNFDHQRHVAAVEVDMRGPQPWNFFGINQTALIA